VERLTGGASRGTWSFDALIGGTWRQLVFRGDRTGRGPLTLEAAAFEAAARAGVPEPGIVARDAAFLIMERVEGETIARRILREDSLCYPGFTGPFSSKTHDSPTFLDDSRTIFIATFAEKT